jgi:hypothetical protein
MGTYELSSMDGGSNQDTKRNRTSEREALTSCCTQRKVHVRKTKEIEQARGTHELSSMEGGTIRSPKETERARGTYSLSRVEGGISHEIERSRASVEDSRTIKRRGRDESGQQKKSSDQVAGTHPLPSTERRTS